MLSSAANLNRYAQLAQDMLPKNKPYVLVEGNNKFFYQDLEEFHDCFVKNGGNCENIKKQIEDKLTDRKKIISELLIMIIFSILPEQTSLSSTIILSKMLVF